ncbi:hypothetical protein [Pontibaca methylaminivorans]|uniref:Uncharacterized protein n=1 Tax=Pontibaca methylaminivorans TaxID=515897 RepID=A0A1R3WAA2_9RHOB|nr:hypothetical protein [Pontibaca methylaminivorans]SIT74692.1 hypothetical protein SAMN05421849_0198 [Pontibaca methylaminivorans]
MPEQTEAEALRAFALELLTDIPPKMFDHLGGRAVLAEIYEEQAEIAHPAVASVLRAAAEKVRVEL